MEQMFCSLLHGLLNSLRGPPGLRQECVVVFMRIFSLRFEKQHIQWLISFFVLHPENSREDVFHGSNLAFTSAAYLFFTKGLDKVFLVTSFLTSQSFSFVFKHYSKCQNTSSSNIICNFLWVPVHFSHLKLNLNIWTPPSSFTFHILFRDRVLSFLFCHSAQVKTPGRRLDGHFKSVQSDSPCLNLPLSHLSVSTVSQVRRCVPSTWSSWPGCLTGGSRSRNHPSLFGRLFLMKSSQSQGADVCTQCIHLCSGCYRRTVKKKTELSTTCCQCSHAVHR